MIDSMRRRSIGRNDGGWAGDRIKRCSFEGGGGRTDPTGGGSTGAVGGVLEVSVSKRGQVGEFS